MIVRTNDRRRMLILDDFQGSCLAEMIFRSDILTIACTREWIAVVLVDEVYLYDFNVLATPLYRALTFHNPTGAIAINTDRVLACPGEIMGHVHVRAGGGETSWRAHDEPIARIALGHVGFFLLATVSARGTILRLWTTDGYRIAEFDCGSPTYLTISPDCEWVRATYEHGDVHVFRVSDGTTEGATSFATAHDLTSARCTFGPDRTDTVIAILPASHERVLLRFDELFGGECLMESRQPLEPDRAMRPALTNLP